jgi:hypothetical protein
MPEIQVVGEGEVPVGTKPEPAPTAVQEPVIINTGAQSPLALLRANREKLKADLFLDLKVPRWEVGGRQL